MVLTGASVVWIFARYRQCARAKILNPKRISNQKLAASNSAIAHKRPSKNLSIFRFIKNNYSTLTYYDTIGIMIDYSATLSEIWRHADVSAIGARDASDLVAAATRAIKIDTKYVLVDDVNVPTIWPWLERSPLELIAEVKSAKKKSDAVALDLAEKISSVLRRGAAGVAVVGRPVELVPVLMPVRDDLFFGKKLFFIIDLQKTEPLDWLDIWTNLAQIRSDGIIIRDVGGRADADDVAGRIFGMLDTMPDDFSGMLMFDIQSMFIMEIAYRLVQKARPTIAQNLRFFIKA